MQNGPKEGRNWKDYLKGLLQRHEYQHWLRCARTARYLRPSSKCEWRWCICDGVAFGRYPYVVQTHRPGEQLSQISPTPTAISARISGTRVLSRTSISVEIGLGTLRYTPLMDVRDSVLTLSPTTQQRSRRLFGNGTVGRYISLHNSRWGTKRAYN